MTRETLDRWIVEAHSYAAENSGRLLKKRKPKVKTMAAEA
jgi:hypothetical protein